MNILSETIKNGGGTFNLDGTVYTGGGYAVGTVTGSYAIVDTPGKFWGSIYALFDAINEGDVVASQFGTWVHDGFIHIDPVVIYEDIELAKVAGYLHSQLAIFNLDTLEEVTL